MKLSDLERELNEGKRTGDAEIRALCADSRVVEQGDLFFCFRGTHTDAHRYAKEALIRGAAAIVCETPLPLNCPQIVVEDGREAMSRISAGFYGHPERKLKTVAVTGTNGKTTTVHFLYRIFSAAGRKTGMIGTLGAKFGAHSVAPSLTTPDPIMLFSLLTDMVKEGVGIVVMEVSAHALALKKDVPICYDAAIFTNLTRDHLDFFRNMTAYGRAKAELFTDRHCRYAVLNADDAFTETLKKGGMEYGTYGLDCPADAFAMVEEHSLKKSRLILNLNDTLLETELYLSGRHNVYNALAAAMAAQRLGVKADAIARGIAETKEVSGRLEWVANFHGADIFVDFAHTPDGLEKSLSSLREDCKGKLWLIFGCGGNRDGGKRTQMGEVAAKGCDFCVITSDNPRYEDPCAIIAEIEQGYRAISKHYVAVEDRERAIEYALNKLQQGDILLVAGKGAETTQEIMGIKYGYNDKTVIKTLLEKFS